MSQEPPQQPPQQPNDQPPYSQPYPPPGYVPQPDAPQGYAPQPPSKKKNKVLLIIGGSIGVLLIACCGFAGLAAHFNGSATTTVVSSTATGSSSSPSTPTPQKSTGPAKVGDTIATNGVSVSLMSATPIQGDDYTHPKPGNEFVVVHVKIVNKSGSEVDYNEYDFHVKTGSGNITGMEYAPTTYTANNQLNSGKLADGGSVEGDIIFQAPIGDHQASFTWQSDIFGNAGDNAWNLGL